LARAGERRRSDFFPVGDASGLVNAGSNTGAFLSPILIGSAISVFHEWNLVLVFAAVVNVVAAALWMLLYVRA